MASFGHRRRPPFVANSSSIALNRHGPLIGSFVLAEEWRHSRVSSFHDGEGQMHFGVSMFHTDYSIPAVDLAQALEARGFESMWAPEHSHILVPRRTPFPGGGELPKPYYEIMDPFVVLGGAAAVTTTLKLATGVCLVVQRDPIQTAKAGRLDRPG